MKRVFTSPVSAWFERAVTRCSRKEGGCREVPHATPASPKRSSAGSAGTRLPSLESCAENQAGLSAERRCSPGAHSAGLEAKVWTRGPNFFIS